MISVAIAFGLGLAIGIVIARGFARPHATDVGTYLIDPAVRRAIKQDRGAGDRRTSKP